MLRTTCRWRSIDRPKWCNVGPSCTRMISEDLYITIRQGLRSSERLRTHIVVGDDSGRVILSPERVLSRSRQLVHRRDCMPFAFVLPMLPCQTSACLMLKKILLRRSRQLERGRDPMPLLSGPGPTLLSDPQCHRCCKQKNPWPISSTRAPARFHACCLALAVL